MSKVQGGKELQRSLRVLKRKYPNAAMRAMYEEALLIFEMSQELVPVDTNRLRLSGLVSFKNTFAEKVIFISYGTAYALRVHEDATAERNRRARADKEAKTGKKQRGATKGQWKYLEVPFEIGKRGIEARAAARMMRMLKGKGNIPPPRVVKGQST